MQDQLKSIRYYRQTSTLTLVSMPSYIKDNSYLKSNIQFEVINLHMHVGIVPDHVAFY